MSETQLAVKEPRTVKEYLALPAYKDRFTEVLKQRAPQFMAAITAVSQMPGLKDAEPRSIIAASMVAATLDLPVNPTLGQAHIVAYSGMAQFQVGYKGLIQLALRSGQYRRMNAGPVNQEVFAGYDAVGEPRLDWSKFDPSLPVGGYFCAFELVNGFTKIVYWSRAQVESHGKRFSKAYQRGMQSSPWLSDFDSMATKTVIKNALTKWGVLSVEMQNAVVHDQGVQADVDASVKYVDGEDKTAEGEVERAAPKPRSQKGAALVKENPAPKPVEVVVEAATEPAPAPAPKVESFAEAAEATSPIQRTSLNAGETIVVEAMVDEFSKHPGQKDGKPIEYIKARVRSPEYAGEVADLGMSPLWNLDFPLKLTLRGNGKRVFADKVEGVV